MGPPRTSAAITVTIQNWFRRRSLRRQPQPHSHHDKPPTHPLIVSFAKHSMPTFLGRRPSKRRRSCNTLRGVFNQIGRAFSRSLFMEQGTHRSRHYAIHVPYIIQEEIEGDVLFCSVSHSNVISPVSPPLILTVRPTRCPVSFCERRRRIRSLSLDSRIRCGTRCLRGLSVRPGVL